MSIEQRSTSNSSESCTASLPSVGSGRARSRIRQWAHQRVSRVGLGCSLCGHGSPGAARSRCCARAVLLRGGAVGCLLLHRDVVLSRAGAGRTRPPRRRMPADHHTRHWVPFLRPDRAWSRVSVFVRAVINRLMICGGERGEEVPVSDPWSSDESVLGSLVGEGGRSA